MQTLLIRGGRPLAGHIRISGSKNAALPILAASVLCTQGAVIHNCPRLTDVNAALNILEGLGAAVRLNGDVLEIDSRQVQPRAIPSALTGAMRGSVLFAGAMLGRFGQCRLCQPGGCALGRRPVDFHREGFLALGAGEASEDAGCFCTGLRGGRHALPYPSVGATENLILAALGGEEETILENAAREPEIVCLCDFLRSGGCEIFGDGSSVIRICPGLPKKAELALIPDRMEAATFACAAASAGGEICLEGAIPGQLAPVLDALEQAGCRICRRERSLELSGPALHGTAPIVTGPYPGFPTDAQAPFLAAMLRAEGETILTETVFSDRMKQIPELEAMGARIGCRGDTAWVRGGKPLRGTEVQARDLRGGAALAVAALAAEGETRLKGLHHLLRGYEDFSRKLRALGADAVAL